MNYTITINKRHILIGITLLIMLGATFFGGMKISDAVSHDIKLLGNKNFKFHLFDDANYPEGSSEIYNLPSPQGRNGDVYVFKAIENGLILPNPGVTINQGGIYGVDRFMAQGQVLILIADSLNDTWWAVSET